MTVYTFKPDRHSSHMKIIRYISNLDKKKLKILDVGCSRGFIGQKLGRIHDFYGIDSSGEDAKFARKFYKYMKICDLEGKKPGYSKEFFDVIIMADVIEHLKNSLEAIVHFKKFLKDDGIIILSIPNFANIYARLKLLFGNFDYEEKGLFDNTHLRFFTLKTIRKLVSESNLKIIGEDITPIPLPIISPLFSEGNLLGFLHQVNYMVALAWRRMFAFQFIVYCKK